MVIIKCKMCGGDIQPSTDQNYGTCDFCGSVMTLPKTSDERRINLFNRANHFRRLNDFDKALNAYENILNENDADAEAHWGVVLSRYGIEYVEDPSTHLRIPTCHRVQMEPILSDPDYIAALENSPDIYTKNLYEEEAKKISEIQKNILAISSQEEQYDIFICYKENTESGSRTADSILAQDIYYELTKEGYKVFFSRITLEDKLGKQYEPYIFAALNSAKVMIVVGTKIEYVNATWVKNEWSRYLSLMKKDKSKVMIPCYRDMDAYDLPEELSVLQSQDMSKLGFMQDLIRGVKKILEVGQKPVSGENNNSSAVLAPSVYSLFERAQLFLEDGDYNSANEYFDRILDINPKYANAYIGKLLAELRLKCEGELTEQRTTLEQYGNYQKAVRFADPLYKEKLESYNLAIRYNNAIALKERASTKEGFLEASKQFQSIINFRDAADLVSECENMAVYTEAIQKKAEVEYEEAAKLMRSISDFRDAAALAAEYDSLLEQKRISDEQAKAECIAYAEYRAKYSDEFKRIEELKKTIKGLEDDIEFQISQGTREAYKWIVKDQKRIENCKAELKSIQIPPFVFSGPQ